MTRFLDESPSAMRVLLRPWAGKKTGKRTRKFLYSNKHRRDANETGTGSLSPHGYNRITVEGNVTEGWGRVEKWNEEVDQGAYRIDNRGGEKFGRESGKVSRGHEVEHSSSHCDNGDAGLKGQGLKRRYCTLIWTLWGWKIWNSDEWHCTNLYKRAMHSLGWLWHPISSDVV